MSTQTKLQTYVFISTYHFLFHINWDYHTTGTAPLMQAHAKLTTVKADVRRLTGAGQKKAVRPAITRLTCKNLNEKKIENEREKVLF